MHSVTERCWQSRGCWYPEIAYRAEHRRHSRPHELPPRGVMEADAHQGLLRHGVHG